MANGSLYTGVAGLRVHQELLDVTGNNLANLNTPGYKAQVAHFADLFYQTLAAATTNPSSSIGGTDPVQVGLGVRVEAIGTNFQQGGLTATGNDLDLAIQGNGFFIVNTPFMFP
jgi:flagellar hook protein FlgE